MTRRSATFQEVDISHCASSQLLPEPSYSVPRDIDLLQKEEKPAASTVSRSRSFLNCMRNFPRMALRVQSGVISGNRSITSSAVTINEYDSDSGEQDSKGVDKERESITSKGPLKHLKKMIKSASFLPKSPKSERRRASLPTSAEIFPTEIGKVTTTLTNRIDVWSAALRAAIELDLRGDTKEAILAYCKFNRQVTKEAIYDFEIFTFDQQKLLNRLMFGLDRRITTLKTAVDENDSNSEDQKPSIPCPTHDTTLRDLYNCLSVLHTVKTLGSTQKMPVVLVYRERRPRTHHRHQDKGKSNKILWAREKREFLQIIGLPKKMITDQGMDYTVRPIIGINGEFLAEEEIVPVESTSQENSESLEMTTNQNNTDKTNGEVVETPFANEPNEEIKNSEPPVLKPPVLKPPVIKPPVKIEKKLSLVDQCLGIRKRFSVSPQRDEEEAGHAGSQYRSNDTTGNVASESKSRSRNRVADIASTLSCDSCSSNEESSASDVEEDETDTAVLANYYHRESLLPSPFQIREETYIVFVMEKVGVKKTYTLNLPFLRMSIRDADANLLSREQETLPWEIINENYLRAPSSIFVHETLEQLPEDTAIFMEIRHFMQEKRKICTVCYTFLEKSDIKQGEFICELYKPPVQFKKENLVPYTKKAFFLHFEIKLEIKSREASTSSSITLEN